MLRQLYQQSSGSLNPSSLTNLKPGGAGAATSGTLTTPGISSPSLENVQLEVLDVTAPTLITANVTTGTPAPAGKVLVWDPVNSAFGAAWKLNSVKNQAVPGGQYGVVVKAGVAADSGVCVGTSNGNISQGAKALVVTEGPVQAFCTSVVNTTAISAGMPLAADGAGNLTYAGGSPAAGTVLATAAGNLSGSVSTPSLLNVYVGGF